MNGLSVRFRSIGLQTPIPAETNTLLTISEDALELLGKARAQLLEATGGNFLTGEIDEFIQASNQEIAQIEKDL